MVDDGTESGGVITVQQREHYYRRMEKRKEEEHDDDLVDVSINMGYEDVRVGKGHKHFTMVVVPSVLTPIQT